MRKQVVLLLAGLVVFCLVLAGLVTLFVAREGAAAAPEAHAAGGGVAPASEMDTQWSKYTSSPLEIDLDTKDAGNYDVSSDPGASERYFVADLKQRYGDDASSRGITDGQVVSVKKPIAYRNSDAQSFVNGNLYWESCDDTCTDEELLGNLNRYIFKIDSQTGDVETVRQAAAGLYIASVIANEEWLAFVEMRPASGNGSGKNYDLVRLGVCPLAQPSCEPKYYFEDNVGITHLYLNDIHGDHLGVIVMHDENNPADDVETAYDLRLDTGEMQELVSSNSSLFVGYTSTGLVLTGSNFNDEPGVNIKTYNPVKIDAYHPEKGYESKTVAIIEEPDRATVRRLELGDTILLTDNVPESALNSTATQGRIIWLDSKKLKTVSAPLASSYIGKIGEHLWISTGGTNTFVGDLREGKLLPVAELSPQWGHSGRFAWSYGQSQDESGTFYFATIKEEADGYVADVKSRMLSEVTLHLGKVS